MRMEFLTHDVNWVALPTLQHLNARLQELPVTPLIKTPLIIAPETVHPPAKEMTMVDISVLEVNGSDPGETTFIEEPFLVIPILVEYTQSIGLTMHQDPNVTK